MRPVSTRTLALLLTTWLALAAAGGARAGVSIAADSLVVPGLELTGMQADIRPAATGAGVAVMLSAKGADLPAMGWKKIGTAVDGTLDRDELGRWIFVGTVHLRGAAGGALSDAAVRIVADSAANTLELSLTQDRGSAQVALPIDQPSHAQITLKGLPAGWLQGLLSTVWSGRTTTGRIDADLAFDMLDGGIHAAGQFAVDGLGFDSPGGKLAGEKLSGSGRLGIDSEAAGTSLDVDAALKGGSVLLGPLYAQLPAHAVQISVGARSEKGALAIHRLRLTDPDALQLDGELGFTANGDLDLLRLDHYNARFPAAYDRYGKGLARMAGVDSLKATGEVAGHVSMNAAGPQAFAFQTEGLDMALGDGKLGIEALRGAVDWSATDDRPVTKLAWRALDVYRLPNGPAQSTWRSTAGTLSLQRPVSVPLLDGQLHVQSFAWKPAAVKGERLQTSLALTQIDMPALSRALGWPEFKGTIGGAIPSLRYVDDHVDLAGGLSLNVFDGFVDITKMTVARPFGDAPVLTGTLSLRALDLALVTSAFDFGSITGHLDGAVEAMQLVGWKPAAFKATLRADGGGRISQKAVNNLTSVGGGGVAGGLQATVMKIFRTFGYRRIGLDCVLQGDICHMSGLGATKDGFTIVEGSGLPRLTVVGHQKDVDWPTLVRRLEAATQGDGPVVR